MGCGLIRGRCRRGNGGGYEFSPTDEIRPFPPLIALARLRLTLFVPPNGGITRTGGLLDWVLRRSIVRASLCQLAFSHHTKETPS